MPADLPPFEPVTLDELRRVWTKHPEPVIRRMALEIQRYRRLLAEIDPLCQRAHQAYRDDTNGELVAFHLLKDILYKERYRLPDTSRVSPKHPAHD